MGLYQKKNKHFPAHHRFSLCNICCKLTSESYFDFNIHHQYTLVLKAHMYHYISHDTLHY